MALFLAENILIIFFLFVLPAINKGFDFDMGDIITFVLRPFNIFVIILEQYLGIKAIFVSINGICRRKGPANSNILRHLIKR
jgi:hypothetical protein